MKFIIHFKNENIIPYRDRDIAIIPHKGKDQQLKYTLVVPQLE
jgi:hypothetical protein